MQISSTLYDAHGHDHEVTLTAETVAALADDQLLWIDVQASGGSDFSELAKALTVPETSIERVVDLERKPYLDNYTDYFGFAVDAPDGVGSDNGKGIQLGFLVGKNWLLTCHEQPVEYLTDFRTQDRGETLIGALTPALLAVSLLDWHLAQYFAEVARIESDVDRLDETILAEGTQRQVLDQIVAIRARVSRLRAQLATQRPIFYGFSRPDFSQKFDDETTAAFRPIAERYDRAIDEVERTREVVVGSFELFTSMTTQQTNDLVKALTFLTAIIGFCAAVAGLLGMNFELPFFKSGTHGFEIVTGSLVAAAIASMVVARWRRWI